MLRSLYQNKENILKKSQDYFSNSNSLIVKIGVELEFFLLRQDLQALDNQELIKDFIYELKEKILENFTLIYEVEKEQGVSQIEIKSHFTEDLCGLASEIENVKKFIIDFAKKKNLVSSFAAQPFIDDCGNALQFNISFSNEEIFNSAIAGLLEKTNKMMILLAPSQEDYRRFNFELNKNLFKKGKYIAPVNLSCGGDNRTCAIRIPATSARKNKCLEYRVACVNADPFLSMAGILMAMDFGIKNKLELGEKIFGNAFEYKVKPLCGSLEEALENFDNLLLRQFFH